MRPCQFCGKDHDPAACRRAEIARRSALRPTIDAETGRPRFVLDEGLMRAALAQLHGRSYVRETLARGAENLREGPRPSDANAGRP